MDTEVNTQKPIPLWQNRDYLLLWLGQAVSSLGTRLTQFAFPLLIVGLTHSIAAAGLAYGLEQLPYALFSLPAAPNANPASPAMPSGIRITADAKA